MCGVDFELPHIRSLVLGQGSFFCCGVGRREDFSILHLCFDVLIPNVLSFPELRAINTHRHTVALHRGSRKNWKVPQSGHICSCCERRGGMAFAEH